MPPNKAANTKMDGANTDGFGEKFKQLNDTVDGLRGKFDYFQHYMDGVKVRLKWLEAAVTDLENK